MPPPVSVIITCANVADTLAAACESVAWADELLIVDSGSTDGTGEIARRHADRYVVEPWRGYTEQKLFACELVRNRWVFILDGDEACSSELARQWLALDDATIDATALFMTPRRNFVMGRYVRAWSPDWQTRLFRLGTVDWRDEALHDGRSPRDPARVRRLSGWIEHKRHSAAGFGDYFSGRRLDGRLMLVARQMRARGKRCHGWDLIVRPWAAFWKFYLLRGGWRDGTFGLLLAQKSAVSVQLKYAALWAAQREAASTPPASDAAATAPLPNAAPADD